MKQPNLAYAPDRENPVNGTPLSLALRQLHHMLSGSIFWVVISAAILLTSLAGPYFTLERLSFPERLAYWGTTVLLSGVLMTFLSIYAHRLTERYGWNWALVAVLAGVAGILPVVGTVYLAEGVATGFAPGWLKTVGATSLIASVAPPLVAVTVVVNALINYRTREESGNAPAPTEAPESRAPLTLLHKKLPEHLGSEIISVQAQDHYVEVTTPNGSALVLMRLSDVAQALAPLPGLQVHRSWWVSLDHIAKTERGANGPDLVLTTGQTIPVGRSFRTAFKEAMQARG